jgi:hypothetical protein
MLHRVHLAQVTRLTFDSSLETIEQQIDNLVPELVDWDNNTAYFRLCALEFEVPDGPVPEFVEYNQGRLIWGMRAYFPLSHIYQPEVYVTEPLVWTLDKAKSEGTGSYALAAIWLNAHGLTEALQANDRQFYDPHDPRFVVLSPVTNFA